MVGERHITVKHPYSSAVLVGETTRRTSLNLDRGSGPLDTQRIAGKREPHLSNQGKVASTGMAPSGLSRESYASKARLFLSLPPGIHHQVCYLLLCSY